MDAPIVKQYFSSLDDETCKTIAALCNGTIEIDPHDIPDQFEGTQKWVGQCHNYPSQQELVMSALNDVIDGFGVEPIRHPDDSNDIVATYVNTGDTYSGSIVHSDGEYHLSSWGDFYEKWLETTNEEDNTVQCGWCSHLTPFKGTQPVADDECPNCQNGTVGLEDGRIVCRGECGHDYGEEVDLDWRDVICEACGNFVNGKEGPGKDKGH